MNVEIISLSFNFLLPLYCKSCQHVGLEWHFLKKLVVFEVVKGLPVFHEIKIFIAAFTGALCYTLF
jgi:hypothetical protein